MDLSIDCIDKAAAAGKTAKGLPGSSRFIPCLALNRLALDSLMAWREPAERDAAICDAMNKATIKPSQTASIVAQMELMSWPCDARSVVDLNNAALQQTASRLIELAQRVRPGHTRRSDRPVAALPVAKPAPAAKKVAPAAAERARKSQRE